MGWTWITEIFNTGVIMKKTTKYAVIDSEGIIVTDKSRYISNKYKHTTCFVRKIAMILFDPENMQNEPETFEWLISLPREVDPSVIKRWKQGEKFHGLKWESDGKEYLEVLRIIQSKLKNVDRIFAKGNYMETRVLNNLGMYNNSICLKFSPGPYEYEIEDLNYHGVDKYDDAMKKFQLKQGGDIKFEKHDPLRECWYFMGEILKLYKSNSLNLKY